MRLPGLHYVLISQPRAGLRSGLVGYSFSCALTALGISLCSQGQAPAVTAQLQPPAGRQNAAEMDAIRIPSRGALLNAFLYVAAGSGPHPTIVLLHGLPGNERNLDLAQDIRRSGWNVLYMDYRGSWGSPGEFSFTHSVEDVTEVVAYLRDPAVASKYRINPKRLVLIGHSMGGFLAVEAAASDPSIEAVALISPVDFGGMVPAFIVKDHEAPVLEGLVFVIEQQGLAPLSGCTAQGLGLDVLVHAPEWRFSSRASALITRPVFLMSSDDGLTESSDMFAADLRRAGSKMLTTRHLATDHSYSDQRLALSSQILQWLSGLPLSGTK